MDLATPAVHELTSNTSGPRLDRFLADRLSGLTRSYLKRLITEGYVAIGGLPARPSQRLHAGDVVRVTIPEPRPTDLVPQPMDLSVVYEDGALLVVDKPPELTVHPGPGHPDRTLVNAIIARCPDLTGVGGALRPGIVHRLDKDTSGLIIVAKNGHAHANLSQQMKDRVVRKKYLALVKGRPGPEKGAIDAPIGRDPRNRKRMAVIDGGRQALTEYQTVRRYPEHTLLEVSPITGRTHQIRVHLSFIHHPVVGDPSYGGRSALLGRQFLHAAQLRFRQPTTGAEIECHAPLPPDLAGTLDFLDRHEASGGSGGRCPQDPQRAALVDAQTEAGL